MRRTGSLEAGPPGGGRRRGGVLRKSASASKSGVASAVKRASSLASFIWNGRVHSRIIAAAAGPRSPDSPPRRSSRVATSVISWASGASSCRKKPSGRRRLSLRSSPTCRPVSSARWRCSKHLKQLPVISSCTGSAEAAWLAILSSERGCADDDASALATAMVDRPRVLCDRRQPRGGLERLQLYNPAGHERTEGKADRGKTLDFPPNPSLPGVAAGAPRRRARGTRAGRPVSGARRAGGYSTG
jgi:hypothetical protein